MTTTNNNVTTSPRITPQTGPQSIYLSSNADIAIYGGAAGGGKTWALLMEPLYHTHNPGFGSVIFRRTYPQITSEGGLWQESFKIYPYLDATPREGELDWRFPSGSTVSFRHLALERNKLDWQGAQIPLIGFDELTHFTASQFWYMLSRNRSMCGVKPYIRGTCNPDPDSFVLDLIKWYINPETGFAIPERSGQVRWFVRIKDVMYWADSKRQLLETYPNSRPKSFTFVVASVYDNKALLEANPDYLANLESLPLVDRERLLGGNWFARLSAGRLFNRNWFQIQATEINNGVLCRFFDFAATAKKMDNRQGNRDPDYTASTLMRKTLDGRYIIEDVQANQYGPADVETLFYETIYKDVYKIELENSDKHRRGIYDQDTVYMVRWEIEPGSAGIRESYRLAASLEGIDAIGIKPEGDKIVRAKPLARECQPPISNVYIMLDEWNDAFLSHMHGQPDLTHDDIMDSASGAYNTLEPVFGCGIYV